MCSSTKFSMHVLGSLKQDHFRSLGFFESAFLGKPIYVPCDISDLPEVACLISLSNTIALMPSPKVSACDKMSPCLLLKPKKALVFSHLSNNPLPSFLILSLASCSDESLSIIQSHLTYCPPFSAFLSLCLWL